MCISQVLNHIHTLSTLYPLHFIMKYRNKPLTVSRVALDAEWEAYPNQTNVMITTQIASPSGSVVILEHPTLGYNLAPTWNGQTIFSSYFGHTEIEHRGTPDAYWGIESLVYFAPSDILAACFRDYDLCMFIQKGLQQSGRLKVKPPNKMNLDPWLILPVYVLVNGLVTQYLLKINDLSRVSGSESLLQVMKSLGIPHVSKELMDEYKTHMGDAYIDHHEDYMEYAGNDASVLFGIEERMKHRDLHLHEVLGIPKRTNCYPMTVGAQIGGVLKDWLHQKIGAAHKLYTKQTHTGRIKSLTFAELLRFGGVSHFAKTSVASTLQTAALVQGGRAKNERPTEFRCEGVIADADFSSCYATNLKHCTYPVGIPSTYHRSKYSRQKPLTLGRFLSRYANELVPRLYQIVVSGSLTHHQTLIPSKLVDDYSILEEYDEDNPKISADFRLYTQEITKGIITSDVLEVLRNVCTAQEWGEYKNLTVISAVYYPRSTQCATVEEYTTKLEESKGDGVDLVFNPKKGTSITYDNLPRYWVGIPLKEFIDPFTQRRKEFKSERCKHPRDSDAWREFDAKQVAMKLASNTSYGVIASPYFPCGCVVVANNTTAMGRVSAWLLASSAGTYQSITDGGAYDLNNVRDWVVNKPGMNTMSLWHTPHRLPRQTRERLMTKPLGGEFMWVLQPSNDRGKSILFGTQTKQTFERGAEDWAEIDDMLLDHMKQFFRGGSKITLLDEIGISHKDLYTELLTHSQTNYRLRHVNGEMHTKVRGHQTKKYRGLAVHQMFRELSQWDGWVSHYPPQSVPQVLKVNQANELVAARTHNSLKEHKLLAGDTVWQNSWVRPISLSMFHWLNDDQFQSWNKRNEQLKRATGYGIEQYFVNPDDPDFICYGDAIRTAQDIIYEGHSWVLNTYQEIHTTKHPYLGSKPERVTG